MVIATRLCRHPLLPSLLIRPEIELDYCCCCICALSASTVAFRAPCTRHGPWPMPYAKEPLLHALFMAPWHLRLPLTLRVSTQGSCRPLEAMVFSACLPGQCAGLSHIPCCPPWSTTPAPPACHCPCLDAGDGVHRASGRSQRAHQPGPWGHLAGQADAGLPCMTPAGQPFTMTPMARLVMAARRSLHPPCPCPPLALAGAALGKGRGKGGEAVPGLWRCRLTGCGCGRLPGGCFL
jgi:hypothetical protein